MHRPSQVGAGVGQQHAGGIDLQHLDAPSAQSRQELEHIEAVDEGVGQIDEHPRESRFSH